MLFLRDAPAGQRSRIRLPLDAWLRALDDLQDPRPIARQLHEAFEDLRAARGEAVDAAVMRCLGLLDEFALPATEVADSPRASGKPPGRKASGLSADASWEEVANAPLSVLAGVGPKREKEFAKFGLQRLEDVFYHLPFRY